MVAESTNELAASKIRRREAVERFVVPEIGLLYRVAFGLTRNQADAEDLVQDTLLRAFRGIDGFDGKYPRAWLLKILRNTHINRARKRKPELLLPGDEMVSVTDASGNASEDSTQLAALNNAFGAEVASAFKALPDKFRSVVELVDVDGLSYQDAAAFLSIPQGTVMSRLHRGRARLRKVLASQGIAPGSAPP
ncbi:MAG: RNA polymerase sigma factor [Actinomycetota bacterium]